MNSYEICLNYLTGLRHFALETTFSLIDFRVDSTFKLLGNAYKFYLASIRMSVTSGNLIILHDFTFLLKNINTKIKYLSCVKYLFTFKVSKM